MNMNKYSHVGGLVGSAFNSVEVGMSQDEQKYYCSLAKERPWAEHLTGLPNRGGGGGVGALSAPALTTKKQQ